jgi:hypothetical protein
MLDVAFTYFVRSLSWTFAIGLAGCLIVIPIAAVRMFSVLFEHDTPAEE